MKIGIDLSVIQTPHRKRGIGATAINFIKHIPSEIKKDHEFVLFLYKEKQAEALEILDLKDLNYEIRTISKPGRITLSLPGKLNKMNSLLNRLKNLLDAKRGDSRTADLSEVYTYLQFDQMQPPPKVKAIKTTVILYDLIPYIMEADYLWSYSTARRHGNSRKSALKKAFLRKQYISQTKAVCRTADSLVAISEHTKRDFMKYAGVPRTKIKTIHLGIAPRRKTKVNQPISFEQYIENSWGYFLHPVDLKEKPFLLFVGGADARRKLVDLVAAYNNLKAQCYDIRLVLAGDTMKGPKTSPVLTTQQYISGSSYLDDIAFLGFVSDKQREWLYENALAFVYPSVYEGFGLPILEPMQYGTPVVTYKNTSIQEVAGDAAIYTHDALSIKKCVEELINNEMTKEKYAVLGKEQAKKFSWARTSSTIIKEITS